MLLVPRFKDLTIPSVSLPGLFFPLLLLFAQHVKKKKKSNCDYEERCQLQGPEKA